MPRRLHIAAALLVPCAASLLASGAAAQKKKGPPREVGLDEVVDKDEQADARPAAAKGAPAGEAPPARKRAAAPRKRAAGAPAAAATPAAPPPEELGSLDRGLEHLEAGEFEDAAVDLYKAYAAFPPADPRHERAQVHLALALRELGLYQAAIEHLVSAAEKRTVQELLPLSLGILAEEMERGRADREMVGTFLVALEVGTLAGDKADVVGYYQGLADLRLARVRWAEESFRHLRTPEFRHRAALALAAWRLALGEDAAAAEGFAKVAGAPDAPPAARALATLSLARLALERGAWEEAQKLYQSLPEQTATEPDVLMERAWVALRTGDLRRALGFLVALEAPRYRGELLPDKYLLRALIYGQACHFRAARRTIRAFSRDHAEAIEALRAVRDPEDSPALARMLDRVPSVAPLAALRRALGREGAAAAKLPEPLGPAMADLYGHLGARAGTRLAAARRAAQPDLGAQLLGTAEDLRLVEFELGLSLHKRIRGDTVARSERLGPPPPIPAAARQVYFRFDEEYWSDEINDLTVYLEDLCVE